jgi:glycosyltransferase involved in cell wall biosynthesis
LISIIILTFNDEVQIRNCLESLSDITDDIVIVDSYSSDKTIEICAEYGARIFKNPFINQAIQCNWALDNIEFKNEWILRLDSDEILPKKIKKEIYQKIKEDSDINGYFLNRRMYWMGRWLRFGRMYPHHILRLFRSGFARYEEKTEEHLIVDGRVDFLKNDFLEDNKKNNLDYFTEKHLQTAKGEVREIKDARSGEFSDGLEPKIFGYKVNRTRWLKEKVYSRTSLFVRPFLYFIYRYVLCLGFLDGKAGLIFHVLQGFWYRFYIDSKVFEEMLDEQQQNFDDV